MSRDYAKKPRATTRRKAPAKKTMPGWLWLFIGLVIGALVTFLIYLWELAPTPSKTVTAAAPHKVNNEKAPKPRFDFYKLLQESEVIVPATEAVSTPTPDKETPAPKPTVQEEYLLQVGSFARQADADRLRAQLIMLNLDANLEQVTINGDIWHRVVVGPFREQAKLSSARAALVANQYNALVLKRKIQ